MVRMLRWLFGYLCFSVSGSFPERLFNVLAQRGVRFWDFCKQNELLTARIRRRDRSLLLQAAARTEVHVHIVREGGLLPFLFRFRYRSGLVIGLLLWGTICHLMGGYIWHLQINAPDSFNEYELRSMLREQGVFEGARSDSIDPSSVVNHLTLADNRISWMSVNLIGTDAEINISPRVHTDNAPSAAALSNIVAAADGTVTSVHVYNGSAAVKAGEGIRKGQLLVSGTMEYNNGSVVTVNSSACILAQTSRSVSVQIPKEIVRFVPQGDQLHKSALSAFGLRLPLSLSDDPPNFSIRQTKRLQPALLGHPLPFDVTDEYFQCYEKQPVTLTRKQAEILLEGKYRLYEFFMLASAKNARMLHTEQQLTERDDCYILQTNCTIEEDVGKQVVINLAEEQETPPD